MTKLTCVGCGVVDEIHSSGVALNGKDGPLCADCLRAVTNSVLYESAVKQGMSPDAAQRLLTEGVALKPQWWMLYMKLLENYSVDFLGELKQRIVSELRDDPAYPHHKVYTDTWGWFKKRPGIYVPLKGTSDPESVEGARRCATELIQKHAKAKFGVFYEIPDPEELD